MALIDNEAVDVVQIGQGASGITGAMQIADFAYGFDLPVALMNCPGDFMAHLAAALPNHMMMEVVRAGREVCFSVDTRIEDGYIVLGDAPGLGWVFDEERLAKLEVETLTPGVKLAGWAGGAAAASSSSRPTSKTTCTRRGARDEDERSPYRERRDRAKSAR